jgi:hypothetical protein
MRVASNPVTAVTICAAEPPPPAAQFRDGVAGHQRRQHDQTARILSGRPGQRDRVDDSQDRDWIAPAQRKGTRHDREQAERNDIEWTRLGDPLRSDARPTAGQHQDRHCDTNADIDE